MPIKTVSLTDSGSDLHEEIVVLYRLLKGLRPNEPIVFDLTGLTWLRPTLALAIGSYIASVPGSSFVGPINQSVSQYLRAIDFPGGIASIGETESVFQAGRTHTTISLLERNGGLQRERLKTIFEELVASFVEVGGSNRSMFIYPLEELTANIFDHGDTDRGYIIGQYDPQHETLEIAVIDRGQGFAERYRGSKGLGLSDEQAIDRAMEGFSSKNEKTRGYGIRTSKRMVCEGLCGKFVLLSGSAVLLADASQERVLSLTDFSWQGSIVCWHIKKPKAPVDFTRYLE